MQESWVGEGNKVTKSIEELAIDYEDDKNSMIAVSEKGNYAYTLY